MRSIFLGTILLSLPILAGAQVKSPAQIKESTSKQVADQFLLKNFLTENKPTKVEIVTIKHHDSIYSYADKIEEAVRKDVKLLNELQDKTKPGEPFPYDARLGLSKEDYDKYIEAWNKRSIESMAESVVRLEKNDKNLWKIRGGQGLEILNNIEFDPKSDTWITPEGKLVRIQDVDTSAMSVWGAWKGQEWRIEKEDDLTKLKENIALGKTADGKYAFIVYRFIETTKSGRILADRGMVLRVALSASGAQKSDPLMEEAKKRAAEKRNKRNP